VFTTHASAAVLTERPPDAARGGAPPGPRAS
jgi:hypothetical protein